MQHEYATDRRKHAHIFLYSHVLLESQPRVVTASGVQTVELCESVHLQLQKQILPSGFLSLLAVAVRPAPFAGTVFERSNLSAVASNCG